MAETPKNSTELARYISVACDLNISKAQFVLDVIGSIDLRIVPVEPSDSIVQAMQRAYDDPRPQYGPEARMYSAAIAASPFAPENTNG